MSKSESQKLHAMSRRNRDAGLDNKRDLLDWASEHLHEIQEGTDPKRGEATETGKDLAAFEALEIVGVIARSLAGWAIDHQLGLAIADKQFVGLTGYQTKEHPDYLSMRSEVDIHEHELKGAAVASSNGDLTGSQMRRFLRNLLYPNSLGMLKNQQMQFVKALDAAQFGEPNDFFIYGSRRSRKNFSKAHELMFEALAYVRFHKQLDGTEIRDGWADVSIAFGVEINTVKGWSSELKAHHGALRVAECEAMAKHAAEYVKVANCENSTTSLKLLAANGHLAHYDRKRLDEYGEEYQKLERSGNKSKEKE
jgi:hypothetical protein